MGKIENLGDIILTTAVFVAVDGHLSAVEGILGGCGRRELANDVAEFRSKILSTLMEGLE